MTKQEKIIVSAYTGVLMCNFEDLHKYIEELLERPVLTHELADEKICQEIKEKCREDFLELCRNDTAVSYDFYAAAGQRNTNKGKKPIINRQDYAYCPDCNECIENERGRIDNYCWNCGCKIDHSGII